MIENNLIVTTNATTNATTDQASISIGGYMMSTVVIGWASGKSSAHANAQAAIESAITETEKILAHLRAEQKAYQNV